MVLPPDFVLTIETLLLRVKNNCHFVVAAVVVNLLLLQITWTHSLNSVLFVSFVINLTF